MHIIFALGERIKIIVPASAKVMLFLSLWW